MNSTHHLGKTKKHTVAPFVKWAKLGYSISVIILVLIGIYGFFALMFRLYSER